MTSALINAFINKGDQCTAMGNDDLAKKSYLQALKQLDVQDEKNNNTKKIIYEKLIAIEQKNKSTSALLYLIQGLLYFTDELYQDAKSHFLLGMQADQDGKILDAKMAKSIVHALNTCNLTLGHFKTKVVTDPVAHQHQCRLYYTNKQYSLAVKYISGMISYFPETSIFYFNRALSLHSLKNNSLAMQDINTAIWLNKIDNQTHPTNCLEYYKCRRNIHLDNKDFQKSLDDHQFILKSCPENIEKIAQAFTDELERRAVALLKTKDFASALTYYQLLHHLNPDDEGIKHNINTILQLFVHLTEKSKAVPLPETAVQPKIEKPLVIPTPETPPSSPEVVTTHNKEHVQKIRKLVRRLENNPIDVLRIILYLTRNNLDANDYLSQDMQNNLSHHADRIMQGIFENKIDPNEVNKLILTLFSNKQAETNCNKLYQFNLFDKFFPKIDDKEEVMRIMRMEDKINPSLKVIYDCFLNLMPTDTHKTNLLIKACFTTNPNTLFSPIHQNQPENTKRENNAQFTR